MFDRFRLLPMTCAALCALGLSSCFDLYNEEMVIHKDLSGEAKVEVSLPDTLIEKFAKVQDEFSESNIRKRFDGLKGVTLKRYTLAEGRHPKATIEISFTSLEKLNEAIEANAPASVLAGKFTISKEPDGRTKVERKLGTGTPAMPLPDDSFANYKVHFDAPIVVMGTNSEYYDQPHNDMRYRWTMSTIAASQPEITNYVKRPFPWELIAIIALALLLVTWFGWLIFGSVKKKMKLKADAQARAKARAAAEQEAAPQQAPQTPQRPGPPRRPGPPGR